MKLTPKEIEIANKLGHKTFSPKYIEYVLSDIETFGADRTYMMTKGYYEAIKYMVKLEEDEKS